MSNYSYDAFISYSRKDFTTVKELHSFLQSYYVGGLHWPRKIFLDVSSLSGKEMFPKTIKTSLDESKYLVVCCSTHSKFSTWVDAEIEYFLRSHSNEKIIICLIGEPELEEIDIIPERILNIEKNSAISLLESRSLIRYDFRSNGRYLRSSEYRQEGLGIILGILGLNRDEAIHKIFPFAIAVAIPLYLSIIIIAGVLLYKVLN